MKLFFIAADLGGSSWYRIIQPAGMCDKLYESSHWGLAQRLNHKLIHEADMVIIQRQCDPIAFESNKRLIQLNKVVVSEIDDNIWSIPKNTPGMSDFWNKEHIKGLEDILRQSFAVTVSTPTLAKIVKEFNPNVYVLPNLIFIDQEITKIDTGKIRIGWSGSDTHLGDFHPGLCDALLDLKDEYKDKIDIFMFGTFPEKLFTKVTYYPFVQPHLYLAELHKLGMDIGLVPNLNNSFNNCRSNLKFLEYSSVRAVTIANKIDSYRNSIVHGRTGLLISKDTKKNWYYSIKSMIEDEKQRKEIADRAHKYCLENFSLQEKKDQYSVYFEIFNKYQGG